MFKATGSLGWAIIGLTLVVKAVSIPVMLPSLKSVKKQRELQPQIDKIKKKYKHDKKKQAEVQMQLMKEHGVNPASGCYTMIITILIFTALYSVIRQITQVPDIAAINVRMYTSFLEFESLEQLSTRFYYLDLAKPDPYYVMAVLAGAGQFILAMSPEITSGTKDWGTGADSLFDRLKSFENLRLPGERRHKNRQDTGPRPVNAELVEKILSLS